MLDDVREILGSWLDGPKAALRNVRDEAEDRRPAWRGAGLGLPVSGSGSAARVGRRAMGFLLDIGLAAVIAAAFTAPEFPGNWSLLVWAIITVVPVSFFGASPGMMIAGTWVARTDGATMVGPLRAMLRCVLTALIVPAVVWNFDNRSWHDRISGTIVLHR